MKKIIYLLTSFVALLSAGASGSHLMGGQITLRQLSGLTYEITMANYRDTTGIHVHPTATFNVTDVNTSATTTYTAPHNGTSLFITRVELYEYIDTIQFPGPGKYRISWEDCCRNGAILNMSNPAAEHMHLMTEITVDNVLPNSSPVFLNPPVFLAQKLSFFQHNPMPFDADGDSLAWLLEVPLSLGGDTVAGYTLPHADISQPFTLNPLSGEITWMPDSNGHWEASFLIEEFRGGVKIGEMRRDVQIIVVDDTSNWHPVVFNNGSWPVDAQGNFAMNINPNVPFNLTVIAYDQDNDALGIEAYGEPFLLSSNQAQWTVVSNMPGNVEAELSWTPSTSHLRLQAYTVAFRCYEFHHPYVFSQDETMLLYVVPSTGVSDIKNKSAVKVFPNPSEGELSVSFELHSPSKTRLEIADLTGKVVAVMFDKHLPAGINLVENRSLNLAKGMYVANLFIDGSLAHSSNIVIR